MIIQGIYNAISSFLSMNKAHASVPPFTEELPN